MEFNNTKKGILDFYETTENAIKEHNKTFSKLIDKLNEPSSITNKLTNNLDVFMEHSFKDFKDNLNTFQDDQIKFVFDMNKNDYVNVKLPNKNIISIKRFVCNYYSDFIFNAPVESFLTPRFYSGGDNLTNICVLNKRNYDTHNKNYNNVITSFLHCNTTCLFCTSIGSCAFEIWIDDYLNIYMPHIHTYLITNYSKYPLYGFYINMNKLNLFNNNIYENTEILLLNMNNENDKSVIDTINIILMHGCYERSEDARISYKPRFVKVLDFYKYKEKLDFFSQYLSLSVTLEKLLPIKNEHNPLEKLQNENNQLNTEYTIFNQSQKIRELEITNDKQHEELQHLRKERLQYIETEHTNTCVLSDYKKLLEELNKQLTNEFDNLSNKQKEILNLKNINIEYSNIKSNYRVLEDKIENINTEKNKLLEHISKCKSDNNTLIDKNTEITSKLIEERNNIKELHTKLKNLQIKEKLHTGKIEELEKNITIEKEQHQLSKNKINDLTIQIIDKSNNNDNNKNDVKYQNILLTQLKEKNEEIEKIKQIHGKILKDFELNKQNYDKLKSKVFNLFNEK